MCFSSPLHPSCGAFRCSSKVLHQLHPFLPVVLGINRRSPVCTHRVPRQASSTSHSRSPCFSCQARLPGDAIQPPHAGNTLQGQKATQAP